ncbi:MAG: Ppx/GppA family phosphatase [Campylobacter sp.]|nr:Ppx/GppA family phosphatase [Campylobacter sp.]
MAKRTAVIDLGSNSMRMAIFERTSRWAFFILGEYKMKVRLGEGGYKSGNEISELAMQRAMMALSEFKTVAKNYKCNKILCVGTSALRDAPNSQVFIKKVRDEFGIDIKIINGKTEASYGAIAAKNLLSPLSDAITIDIGGGSSELALIKNDAIIDTISLDVGTVRLKELFEDFDKDKMSEFMMQISSQIPANFRSENIIAIGGSLRALSTAIMSEISYPLDILHGFTYELETHKKFIESIINASVEELENFDIKRDRYDTIKQGTFIFNFITKILGSKRVYTSGVGVREGVFLSDFLRKKGDDLINRIAKLPKGLNISVKSLQDRFCLANNKNVVKYANAIYDTLAPMHGLNGEYKNELLHAAKIYNIGVDIGFYSDHINSAFMVLKGLNFGFTHEQKILISSIIATNGKKNIYDYEKFQNLLPKQEQVYWLSFILSLARLLHINKTNTNLQFELSNDTLYIYGAKDLYLAKEEIKKLQKPDIFAVSFM